MPTLKEVQLKIQGVKKTKQITKAMNMVATSRLRGAQGAMDGFRPYAEKFSEVLGSLAEKAGEEASPLLIPKEEVRKIHIVLCTSDRGLCGGFNINLTDAAKNHIKNNPIEGAEYSFTCFGKKGGAWCRKAKYSISETHLGVVGSKFGFNVASTTGKKLVDGFLDGQYDEVYIVYSEFVSMAKQLPVVQKLLPIPPSKKMQPKRVPLRNTRPNISANPLRKNSLEICCHATSMSRFSGHCWKHPPVNTLPG